MNNRLLAKNTGWNLLGSIAPVPAALIVIPLLVEGMGAARFGVLTLAWMVVGYFSFFDLGLVRALTRLVAERIDTDQRSKIPILFWTAMVLMTGMGFIAALVVLGLTPMIDAGFLEIPAYLITETILAYKFLALSVPIVILTSGLRGILEAHQEFGIATALRIPAAVLSYIAPLVFLQYSNSLPLTVGALVAVRLVAGVAHVVVVWYLYPELRRRQIFNRDFAGQLLCFGGWLTVSSIVGPILLYLGRFVIAVQLSAEAVAYFVVPYEVVTQMLMIPIAAVSVLFSAFSSISRQDPLLVRSIYQKALMLIAVVMLPLVAMVSIYAKLGLEIWIDREFSENGYRIAQILALGVFVNSFGLVSQVLIQAQGRPAWTAKLHLVELLLYAPYIVILTSTFGTQGTAIAWTVRVSISTLALLYLANRSMAATARTTDGGISR